VFCAAQCERLRRCLKTNVSEAYYDELNNTYDVYRSTLTGNRIPLTNINILTIAANYAKAMVPRYAVGVETAVLWLLSTRRYYFDGRMAMVGGVLNAAALAMCESVCWHLCCITASVVLPVHADVDGDRCCLEFYCWRCAHRVLHVTFPLPGFA
jgi:hypothetical protein